MNEHTINDFELTIINDGDGSQCGYSYAQRCEAAQDSTTDSVRAFRNMVRNYEGQRLRAGSQPATEAEMQEAARRLTVYYVEHVSEMSE